MLLLLRACLINPYINNPARLQGYWGRKARKSRQIYRQEYNSEPRTIPRTIARIISYQNKSNIILLIIDTLQYLSNNKYFEKISEIRKILSHHISEVS